MNLSKKKRDPFQLCDTFMSKLSPFSTHSKKRDPFQLCDTFMRKQSPFSIHTNA